MQKAAGVYAGELPCADCSGIRTTLYLRANGVYTRISEYVGRDTFEDGGQWTIDEKGVVTMTPAVKGGQPSLARVEEGAVRLLNADGDAVEGPRDSTESLRSSSTAPTSGPTALRAPAFLLLKDNGFAHGPLRQGFRA